MRLLQRIHLRLKNMREERKALAYELVAECRHCQTEEEVETLVGSRIEELRDRGSVRFGIIEIIAIVQLCIKIWMFMKEKGWLGEATPQSVRKAVESND